VRHLPLRLSLLLVVLLLLVPSGTLRAHTRLAASAPAAGSVVRAPAVVRLDFTTRAELALTSVRVLRADGSLVRLGPVEGEREDVRAVRIRVDETLAAGDYVVEWTTGSTDGHPVRGRFTFTVEALAGPGDTAPSGAASPRPASSGASLPEASAPASGTAPSADEPGLLATVLRFLGYVALLGAMGAVTFTRLVTRAVGHAGFDVTEMTARVRRGAALLLALLLLVAAFRLVEETRALLGTGDGATPARILRVLLETRWGLGWLAGAVLSALMLVGVAVAARTRAGWGLAEVAAIGLAFAPGLTGHAAATEDALVLALLSDAAHVLGAALWLGTLGWILAAALPTLRTARAEERDGAVATLFHAFHPVALAGVALVVVSGGVSAWLRLGGLAPLVASRYGQVLLVKLTLLAVVGALGAFNAVRLLPTLGAAESTIRIRRSATAEVAIALAIVAVTAVLVAIPPPATP